nr:hypothetical protein [Heyndrickxia coagulans]
MPYGMHIFGMNRPEASQLVMTGLIGAIIGAPVTGWIASRLGSRKKPYLLIQTLIFLAWFSF